MGTCDTMLVQSAIVLLALVLSADAQRTFMRSCECEYTVDGKCAYTILLPTSYADPTGDGACRSGQTENVISGSVSDKLQQLEQRTQNLTDWNAEQTRLFMQLQSVLIYLQDTVAVMEAKSREDTPGCMLNQSELQSRLQQNAQEVAALKDTVLHFQNAVLNTNAALSEVETDITNLKDGYKDLQEKDIKNEANLAEDHVIIQRLVKDVAHMREAGVMCRQKGLLLAGPLVNVSDEVISASSSYNDQHGPERSMIFNEEKPGAWCPSKYWYLNYYVNCYFFSDSQGGSTSPMRHS